MDLIEKLNYTDSDFALLENALCSVSITCFATPTAEQKRHVTEKLSAAGIATGRLQLSEKNINFIVHQENQNQTIQLLHALID